MKNIFVLLLTALVFFSSCNKDDDDSVNKSRTLLYNATGNFSGTLYMSYTTAAGGTANEQVTSLPWNKEITFDSSVTAANIVLSGAGGTAGQQITLTIKRGGAVVGSPTIATADATGSFAKAAPVVIF